ncbi:MAG: DUF2232 domain-containing protein [Synergistes sp.]|nr:DUF2232 domain-containing protein [Synergistes sp.]
MRGKIIFELCGCTAASILLFFAAVWIPFVSFFALFLAPMPVMILTRRYGLRVGLLCSAAAASLVVSAVGIVPALLYVFEFALLGSLFGTILAKSQTGGDFAFAAIGCSAAVKTALMALFIFLTGSNPFIVSHEAAGEIVKSVAAAISQTGSSVPQSEITEYANVLYSTVSSMLPAMFLLFSAADTLVNYFAAKVYFAKDDTIKLPQLPPFGEWRFPKDVFWALFAALLLDIAGRMGHYSAAAIVSLNIMEVLRGIFVVEGISLVWSIAGRTHAPAFLRLPTAFLCAVVPPLSYVVSILGVFDIWYDLRNKITLWRDK